ncbi:MAG: hypothetical protein H8E15_01025 [Planctomycetes bacterium]|nr:hypothetical protein [Planctomycetota bacterium]
MKISDFSLGITEFLAVLVPGLLTTSVLMAEMSGSRLVMVEDALDLTLVLIVSYIIGQFLFAIGSKWDWLYDLFKSNKNDAYLDVITEIRSKHQSQFECRDINRYQWCRTLLMTQFPAAFLDVARKEADSKLFRSLLFPLIIAMLYLGNNHEEGMAVLCLIMIALAYWRYRGQRMKSCRTAYVHVINLASSGKL